MTSAYPGGLDSFTNPTGTDEQGATVGGRTHSAMHADINDAMEAVQAELGVDPSGAEATVAARFTAVEGRATALEADMTTAQGDIADLETAVAALPGGDARVFDAVTYGALVDGTTDDTAAWQAAINAAASAGGGVVTSSKNGVSVIAGALQDTGGANAQLLLPSVHTSSGAQVSITIEGLTPPPAVVSVIGAIDLPDTHLVLQSTLTSGSGGAMLGGYGPAGTYQGFTLVDLTLRNLTVRMPSNPTHTALNLSNVTAVDLDRVVVDCGSYNVTGLTQPTTSTSYGIKLPKNLNGAHTRLGQVDVVGFYTGILAPEHTFGQYVAAWGCVRGVEVPAGDHASRFARLGVYHCSYGIKFTGGASALDVWQYNAEHGATSEAAWLQTTYDVDDPSNYGSGFIRWWAVLGGTGAHNSFTKNGGSGITTSRVGEAIGSGGGTTTYTVRDRVTAVTGSQVLTLGATPVTNSPLVWVNGAIKWPVTDYTISGATITFPSALTAGDVVAVHYQTTTAGAGSASFASAPVNIVDDFNRANTTNGLGSTSTGAKAWTAHAGTWGIDTNRAYVSAGVTGSTNRATVESGVATCTVSGTVIGSGTAGLIVRSDGASAGNEYVIEVGIATAITPKIYKGTAGAYTTIATGASTTVASGSVLSVELSGNTITVKDDGVAIVSVTDSSWSSNTRHGMYIAAPATPVSPARIDNFSIQP